MANDEYTIPEAYRESTIRAQLDAITTAPATPEIKAPTYQRIKDIEARIFSYREAALALEKKSKVRTSLRQLADLVLMPRMNTLHSLIEQESRLGGRLFGEGQKFWLDSKTSTVFHNDVSDWYYAHTNVANPNNPTVLRFQVTPHSIHKLYNGIEYSPTVEDLENFVRAVEAYSTAVLPLYPLDQTIDELLHDDTNETQQYDLAA